MVAVMKTLDILTFQCIIVPTAHNFRIKLVLSIINRNCYHKID